METSVETLMDEQPMRWQVGGEFGWGEGPPLCPESDYPLTKGLGEEGYRIVDVPSDFLTALRDGVARFFGVPHAELETYHESITATTTSSRARGSFGSQTWALTPKRSQLSSAPP